MSFQYGGIASPGSNFELLCFFLPMLTELLWYYTEHRRVLRLFFLSYVNMICICPLLIAIYAFGFG